MSKNTGKFKNGADDTMKQSGNTDYGGVNYNNSQRDETTDMSWEKKMGVFTDPNGVWSNKIVPSSQKSYSSPFNGGSGVNYHTNDAVNDGGMWENLAKSPKDNDINEVNF